MSKTRNPVSRRTAVGLCLSLPLLGATAAVAASPAAPLGFEFASKRFVHRWSKDGQNEFTPVGDEDLSKWTDMVTINVFEGAREGEGLAKVANQVLANYKNAGQILRTQSKPLTPSAPAEHFVAAALSTPELFEGVFARMVLRGGVGYALVVSHRIYGDQAGQAMSAWIQGNGQRVEDALMAWSGWPGQEALGKLPQS